MKNTGGVVSVPHAHDFVIGNDSRGRPDGRVRLRAEGGERQRDAVTLVVVAAPSRLTGAGPGGALEAAVQTRHRTTANTV